MPEIIVERSADGALVESDEQSREPGRLYRSLGLDAEGRERVMAYSDAEQSAAESEAAAAELEATRKHLRERFKLEGVARISSQVPAWNTLDKVEFVVSIANLLDLSSMTVAQQAARDVYLYVRDDALPRLGGLTLAELEQVEPTAALPFAAVDGTDPGWPA